MLSSQQGRPLWRAPRQRPYSCDVCPKQFETPSKLARHYLTHTGQKPFQCPDCSKTFRQSVHLERHMMTHTLPFKCNICHRHFKHEDTFSKHQRLHMEGARLKAKVPRKRVGVHRRRRLSLPLYCFGCRRTFETEEKRLSHQCSFVNVTAIRRPQKRQCNVCDKVFPSRSKLERHVMIHTGQKPYACFLCAKAFRQKAHLKIHELTHNQEKPFHCFQCLKSFKSAELLSRHEKAHASADWSDPGNSPSEPLQVKEEPDEVFFVIPFQCSACNQCFHSQETLDGHTCEEMNTQVTVGLPIECCDGSPVKLIDRQGSYVEPGFIFPDDSERTPKAESLEETEHSDPNVLEYQQFLAPRNILQPQQKVTPPRKHFGQSHQFLGRHLRNQYLNVNNNNMSMGNRDAGTMHSMFSAAEQRDPAQRIDTFYQFLQQTQGIILPRRKARRCDQCEKTFPSMSKLRRHYLTHTGQKPFTCTDCGRHFRQSAHLKRHQLTHTEKGHLYTSQIALGDYHSPFHQWQENPNCQLHQYSRRPVENRDFNEITLAVPEIKVEMEAPKLPEVTKKPVVTKRAKITLSRVRHAKSCQEKQLQKMRTRAVQDRYKCSVCSKNFLSPSKLERHHLTHSGQRPYVCQECGKSFRQDPHLKRHMVTHVKVKG